MTEVGITERRTSSKTVKSLTLNLKLAKSQEIK